MLKKLENLIFTIAMNSSTIAAFLLAAVLITSGCIDAMDEDTPEDAPEDIPEEEPTVPEDEEETLEEQETETETGAEETDSTSEEVDETIEIRGFADNSYSVEELNIEEGQTVEFIYTHEAGQHDLVLENSEGEEVASTDVLTEEGESDSFTYTFEDADDYEFFCSVGTHRQAGMEGTIQIT